MHRAELEITAPIKRDELLRLLDAMTPFPAREPTRSPRATRPSQMTCAKKQIRSLAVAEHKAPRTVAELRARLDRGESAALWAASCELSPRVVAHLRAEEIAMLPAEIRSSLPEVAETNTPPRIEVTPVPGAKVTDIRSARRAGRVASADSQRLATLLASLAVVLLVGICVVHFLV
jgi:hypothetical protein